MKKQILILTFFVAAILAGSNAFGQVDYSADKYLTAGSPDCATPEVLTCDTGEDELHPLPGVTYSYGVTVNPLVVNGAIHWFVTDDLNVIDGATGPNPILTTTRDDGTGAGNYILLAESGVYDNAANTQATIDISWQAFDPSTVVLLVAYVTDEDGCTDNIEVYRIEPTFGFTLDIEAMFDDGTLDGTGTADECVSPVESAVYDGTANLTMDYGENWVFFSVNAANFVHSWLPEFSTINYTGAGTVDDGSIDPESFQWAYPADAAANTNWNDASVPVLAQNASGAVGDAGECIVVRVRIDHGNDELDTPTGGATLTFGVNGTMYDPTLAVGSEYTNTNFDDLGNGAAGSPCPQVDFDDQADYTLTPRPEILTNTAVGTGNLPFETKN